MKKDSTAVLPDIVKKLFRQLKNALNIGNMKCSSNESQLEDML